MKQNPLINFSYKDKVLKLSKNVASYTKLSNSSFKITFTDTLGDLGIGDTFFNYYAYAKSYNNSITTYKNNLPVRVEYIRHTYNYIIINVLNSEYNILGAGNDDLDIEFIFFNDIQNTLSHYDFFNICINSKTIISKSPLFSSISFDDSVLSSPIITCILTSPIDFTKYNLYLNTAGSNWGEYVYYVKITGNELKIYLKTAHGGDYYNPADTNRHNLSLLIY